MELRIQDAEDRAGMGDGGPVEQRRHSRVALSVPVWIRTVDPSFDLQRPSDTVDVSPVGLQLRLPAYIPLGTRLRVDVLWSDQVTEGRVVWAQYDGRRHWTVGVQFLTFHGNLWRLRVPPVDWVATRPPAADRQHWNWHLR